MLDAFNTCQVMAHYSGQNPLSSAKTDILGISDPEQPSELSFVQ